MELGAHALVIAWEQNPCNVWRVIATWPTANCHASSSIRINFVFFFAMFTNVNYFLYVWGMDEKERYRQCLQDIVAKAISKEFSSELGLLPLELVEILNKYDITLLTYSPKGNIEKVGVTYIPAPHPPDSKHLTFPAAQDPEKPFTEDPAPWFSAMLGGKE